MIPKTRDLRSKPDLVRAYETLREAMLSSGDGAPVPVDAWRLGQEGLLSGASAMPPRGVTHRLSLGPGCRC